MKLSDILRAISNLSAEDAWVVARAIFDRHIKEGATSTRCQIGDKHVVVFADELESTAGGAVQLIEELQSSLDNAAKRIARFDQLADAQARLIAQYKSELPMLRKMLATTYLASREMRSRLTIIDENHHKPKPGTQKSMQDADRQLREGVKWDDIFEDFKKKYKLKKKPRWSSKTSLQQSFSHAKSAHPEWFQS